MEASFLSTPGVGEWKNEKCKRNILENTFEEEEDILPCAHDLDNKIAGKSSEKLIIAYGGYLSLRLRDQQREAILLACAMSHARDKPEQRQFVLTVSQRRLRNSPQCRPFLRNVRESVSAGRKVKISLASSVKT
jgi:hypothetical protein